MKTLFTFIKDSFVAVGVNKLFENCICIDTMDAVDDVVSDISCGKYASIVFKNSIIKNRFFDMLSTARPDINVINCNSSIDSFLENDFTGLLVYNNLKHCKYKEIIEMINKHKGIIIL
jgi:hypothetical protein